MTITQSLQRRAHVVHYSKTKIPRRSQIEKMLRIGYPLATSKQKAFPYKAYVLGPNEERSKILYNLCEGNKVEFDGDVEQKGFKYQANPNLFHLATAPWTLIFTPRVALGNQYAREQCAKTGTRWEMGDESFIPHGRESWSIEVGMIAKTITGAVLDAGWDTSYNICFPKEVDKWPKKYFSFIKHMPYLIQTIGKADLYKWQNMKPESLEKDTCPPFKDIFIFEDDK
tara:strand:- start:2459 stop:3139 length:681 start_codon:yes stop_codon:yes gene_type:complete